MTQAIWIDIGVDVGGTFTDLAARFSDGRVARGKVLSTPQDYSVGVCQVVHDLLARFKVGASRVRSFRHGTTIVSNAIIERRGAPVALITTKGFRDVLEIGRFRAPHLYDPFFRKPDPLISRDLRFEITERMGPDGGVVQPLQDGACDVLVERVAGRQVDAVAVCLLHSYANPSHELRIREAFSRVRPDIHVSLSHEISPYPQEFERTATTVVNAYTAPLFSQYADRLERGLAAIGVEATIMMMKSDGGLTTVEEIRDKPAHAIESGPAAGVVGAARIAGQSEFKNLIVFDVGGTTAKASLITGGHFETTDSCEVGGAMSAGVRILSGGGHPIQIPTVDIAEVGAGGGSIAQSDGFSVSVGPLSAGADPGPACYGRGGTEPTLTDANLVLGYVDDESLAGVIAPSVDAAKEAIDRLDRVISAGRDTIAHGIHRLGKASMARAVRSVSVDRGVATREYAIFAIGGNGPLFATGLADEIGARTVIIPPAAGVYSAFGLLAAETTEKRVFNVNRLLADIPHDLFETWSAAIPDPVTPAESEPLQSHMTIYFSLRYRSQSSSIEVDSTLSDAMDPIRLREEFLRRYEARFGYADEAGPILLEHVSLLTTSISAELGHSLPLEGDDFVDRDGTVFALLDTDSGRQEVSIVSRSKIGTERAGPLLIWDFDCAALIGPGWNVAGHDNGCLVARSNSEGRPE